MKQFMDKDFLLSTPTAQHLFHDYAAKMPILDYHCHINPKEIAEDRKFENITQVWLGGDHYKWRQMRTNGVDEKYITGDASDREKFQKWARLLRWLSATHFITGAALNFRDTSDTTVFSTAIQLRKYGISVMQSYRKILCQFVTLSSSQMLH